MTRRTWVGEPAIPVISSTGIMLMGSWMNRSAVFVVGRLNASNAVGLVWGLVDVVLLPMQRHLIGEMMLLLSERMSVRFEASFSVADVTDLKTITRPRVVFFDIRSMGAMASVCHDQSMMGFED